MLELNDPKWQNFEGGYRQPFDASVPLRKLKNASNSAEAQTILAELWDELHHQGDVGTASYMSVPHLIRIASENNLIDSGIIALITTIEIQRHRNNPPLPKGHEETYLNSLKKLLAIAIKALDENQDIEKTSELLSAIAASKGQINLAYAISLLGSEDVLEEFIEQY